MAGFYTRDNNGDITFQLTDRIVRLLGSITISSSNASGSVEIPSNMQGEPFYFAVMGSDPLGQSRGTQADISGRTVSWNELPVGTIIRYGVY